MSWTTSVLVVANVTAGSEELLEAMKARAAVGPTSFTLLVPKSSAARPVGPDDPLADAAVARMRDAGLDVASVVTDDDPMVAVNETFDPRRHDEIIVSTLPVGDSKWLQIDLPHRVARMTSAPVTHVVAIPRAPRAPTVATAAPEHRSGLLRPLEALTWSGSRRRE
jgi:hypothetical protein